MITAKKIMAIRIYIFPIIALLAFVSMVGCLGSGDDGDTEPPVIVQKSPENAAGDVPVNTRIYVVFNKSVINISIATFHLERVGTFDPYSRDGDL